MGRGLQPGESELPNDAPPPMPQFNEAAMAQLEGMGFPTVRCQKALLATGNNDAEAAMEWLFAHMEDPGTFMLFAVYSSGQFLFKNHCPFLMKTSMPPYKSQLLLEVQVNQSLIQSK